MPEWKAVMALACHNTHEGAIYVAEELRSQHLFLLVEVTTNPPLVAAVLPTRSQQIDWETAQRQSTVTTPFPPSGGHNWLLLRAANS